MKIIYNILFTNGDMGIDAGTVKCTKWLDGLRFIWCWFVFCKIFQLALERGTCNTLFLTVIINFRAE